MATFGDLITRVKLRVGNKEEFDDQIKQNINRAILQVVKRELPQEVWIETTFSTINATESYTFASISATDVYAIPLVRDDTDDIEIDMGSLEHFNMLKQDTSVTSNLGTPRNWVRRGNNIILYNQIPDATARTIKLTYIQRPTDLSADADVLALNDEWLQPIEHLATSMTWLDLGQLEKAGTFLTAYNAALGEDNAPKEVEDQYADAQVIPVIMGEG